MKTTKKISIALAGLTLMATGVGGNLSVGALSGISQEILVTAREVTEEFSVKTNALNPYLRINTIEPKTGSVNGTVSVPEGSDWYIKKIVVAYMNFRQGVSEEEADQNLATLTGYKNSNWNIVSLYENNPLGAKKSQDIMLNQAQPQKKIFINEPDMMYYAVELGTVADGKWTETWWSRGKIDYRPCVHSAVFDKETMSCARVEDGEMVKYLPRVNSGGALIELPEDEEVMTWEEEWRDVILADYEAIQNEMEVMWGYLNDGLMVLDEDDVVLDGILKSVAHYDKADSKLLWVSQGTEFLKGRIAEMRKFYEKDTVVDTSRLEILEKENAALREANTVLEGEKAALEQEKSALAATNEGLKREKGELEQEILRLQAENEALKAEKDNTKDEDDNGQEDDVAMSEIKSLKQEIERMTEEMAEMSRDANQLAAEKAEISVKNTELRQELDKIEAEKQELEQRMAEMAENTQNTQEIIGDQKCEVINIVTEVKEDDNKEGNLGDELIQGGEEEEVKVPDLGGEEVKTKGAWWWLIPVVGLMGVIILFTKRKFFRR